MNIMLPVAETSATPLPLDRDPAAAILTAARLLLPISNAVSRDNNPAGDGARDTLIARADVEGIEAIVLSPVLGDFNEDLREHGVDALRARLRAQLALQDSAWFMGGRVDVE